MRNIVRFNCQFSFLKLMYYKLLKSKSQSLRTENFQKTGFFLDLYLYLIINIIVLVDLINVKCFMNLNWSKWWLYSHFKCAPSLWRRYTAVRAFCMYSVLTTYSAESLVGILADEKQWLIYPNPESLLYLSSLEAKSCNCLLLAWPFDPPKAFEWFILASWLKA